MNDKKYLSILEFSRLTGIKRENLRFYDGIGLLKPEARGKNDYRCYTRRQLSSAYLISCLRLLGVGLEEIRRFSAGRSPEKMLTLFAEQEQHIQKEIARLKETSDIMKQYSMMAREALCHEHEEFLIEKRSKEAIFLCPKVSGQINEDEAEIQAFEYAAAHEINMGCPMGMLLCWENLEKDQVLPDYQYYFKAGKKGNAWKPAGLYAVVYGKYQYQNIGDAYLKFRDFVLKKKLDIIGGVYGEFLLNELAFQEPDEYWGRIEAQVRQVRTIAR